MQAVNFQTPSREILTYCKCTLLRGASPRRTIELMFSCFRIVIYGSSPCDPNLRTIRALTAEIKLKQRHLPLPLPHIGPKAKIDVTMDSGISLFLIVTTAGINLSAAVQLRGKDSGAESR